MAEFPALPLWTDALIGDTFQLTPAEFGAYLRLLIVEWRQPDCALPNDDIFLGRSIGDPKNWHRIRSVVMAYFTLGEDGRYRQKRLLDERDYVSRCAVRASAGGRAKSLKRINRGSAKHVLNDCETAAPTPTPTPTPKKKKHVRLENPEGFDEWFAVYPAHEGRNPKRAKLEFTKAIKLVDFQVLIASTKAFAKKVEFKDPKYVNRAHNWLKDEMWRGPDLLEVQISPVLALEARIRAAMGDEASKHLENFRLTFGDNIERAAARLQEFEKHKRPQIAANDWFFDYGAPGCSVGSRE